MPKLPTLTGGAASREVIETFYGYNHNLKIRDGEMFHTENLTTDYFPTLASRKQRYTRDHTFTRLQAIIGASSWIDNGTVYINANATGLTGLSSTEKQLVRMGSYLCIFPDAKYINLSDATDYGDMGASWSYTGAVSYAMCQQDGTVYTSVTKSATEPVSPSSGDIWIDTEDDTVKEYSAYSQTWIALQTVYTRLDFTTQGQIPAAFKEFDGVEISGLHFDDLNGSKIIYAVGGEANGQTDYLVLIGIQEEPYTEQSASVKVERQIPEMDYVCEAQNRLWGCFYGKQGSEYINEVYCCALGDFRNWSQYLGLSTDSWRASCGSAGSWTGCINYMGTPTFFKNDRIHPITVSPIGAHRLGDIPARGVQRRCHRSLAVVNETLFYKSIDGVMAYQGGMPASVSAALGDTQYSYAAAGVYGKRYFISMKDSISPKVGDGSYHLFCYDAEKGLWIREDATKATQFVVDGDDFLALFETDAISPEYTLAMVAGGTTNPAWVREEPVTWSAETGIQHYEQPDKKYVLRYDIRLFMEKESRVQMFIEYDSSGKWEFAGNVSAGDVMRDSTGSCLVPVRPRRCDHLRLRLDGVGDVKILSIARVLIKGSDR